MELFHPLTPLQHGMLARSLDRDARYCYVIQTVFDWNETIHSKEFELAWQILASRHEVLRSSFFWKETPEPRQVVSPEAKVDFSVNSIQASTPEGRRSEINSFLDVDLRRGFEVFTLPPWRVNVLTAPTGETTAVWTFHHLLLDGRSHILLLREFMVIYDGLLAGKIVETPAETPQQEYARWMEKQDFGYAEDFWKGYLDKLPSCAAFPRPLGRTHCAEAYQFSEASLGPQLTQQLQEFSARTGVSLGNVLQTAWALLL